MNLPLLAVGGLFLLAYATLALIAWRRPLLARIALREAVRRPWQSALLVIGLMVAGIAIVVGLVLMDSVHDSNISNIQQQWGRVDLLVTAGGRFFSPEVATRLAGDPRLQASVAGVQAGIELVAGVSDADRKTATAPVRLVGFDPQSEAAFGTFVLSDGTNSDGRDLRAREVWLSKSLADILNAEPRDQLRLSLEQNGAPAAAEVTVAGILRPEGPGAYGLHPSVLGTVETIAEMAGTDRINVVRLSARGEGQSELEAARRAFPVVTAAVGAMPDGSGLQVRNVKAADLATEETAKATNASFFLGFSFLIVVAAALLAINLAVALAQERRPRLAVLRALGLSRRGLIEASVLEAAIYSLCAAVLSIVPGIAAAKAVLSLGKGLRTTSLAVDTGVRESIRVESVTMALALAALITLATLSVAALRSSRMTIAAAIRDLPEPLPGPSSRLKRFGLAAALALPGIAVLSQANEELRLLGGVLLIVAAAKLLQNSMPDRTRATLAGATLVAWAVAHAILSGQSEPFPLMPILVSVFGLSLLTVANLRLLEALVSVGRVAGRLQAVLRLPLAYTSRRPLRTGLTTGAFAVVLTMVVFLAVFVAEAASLEKSAAYDIRISSPAVRVLQLPQPIRQQARRHISIPTRIYFGPVRPMCGESCIVPLFIFDQQLLQDPPVRLVSRESRFQSDAAVWRFLEDDPTAVVSGLQLVGTTLTLTGPNGPVRLHSVGQPFPGLFDGVIGSEQTLAPFTAAPLGTTDFLAIAPGADSREVATQIRQTIGAQGLDVRLIQDLLAQTLRPAHAFLSVFNALLDLGLAVGVLILGIVILRALIERRRGIGVIRALGFRRREVMATLIAESFITATIGVAVGVATGLLWGYLDLRLGQGPSFQIDGATVGIALGLVYAALIPATIGPALRASLIPPAQALRLVE